MPVIVSLEMLDKEALIRFLTEPRNAITKQYQKMLELDGVELTFDDEALEAIAETSLKRKTGARGLRAIMENVMMDIMYKAPSDETLKACRITEDVVKGGGWVSYAPAFFEISSIVKEASLQDSRNASTSSLSFKRRFSSALRIVVPSGKIKLAITR